MSTSSRCAAFLFLAVSKVFAQGSDSGESSHGFNFYERFQGSVNTLGAVYMLDTSAGYQFNSHIAVSGGLPVYFVRPSSSTVMTTGSPSSNGIGNVYGQFRVTFLNPAVNFESTVTGTAPTGDQASGFSTGHVTVDWSNTFERSFSRVTPFAEVGIANSVSDTMFFVRPYTTYGFIAHLEGGARYRLIPGLEAGGSVYGIEPSGQQTVISRIVRPSVVIGSTRRHHGVFELQNQTTGSSDIVQDYGFSAFVQFEPAKSFDVYASYTHSEQFSLDTVSFGTTVNLGKVIRSLR
jgi:hypothetical protein